MITLKRILVPHDLEETSDDALAFACELARTFGAELLLLHVMENPFLHAVFGDPRDIAASIRQRLSDRLTDEERALLRAKVALKESDRPADAIVDVAKTAEIDLIVMGTHGRRAVERLITGSVAAHVVRMAPCPVLTVRPPTPRADARVEVAVGTL
jgi:nucleotide-binding universal stress UspA family protein